MSIKDFKQLTCDLCGITKIEGIATKKWAVIQIPDRVYLGDTETKVICKTCSHKIEKDRVINRSLVLQEN